MVYKVRIGDNWEKEDVKEYQLGSVEEALKICTDSGHDLEFWYIAEWEDGQCLSVRTAQECLEAIEGPTF